MTIKTEAKPVLSERVRKLRQAVLETKPVLSTERLRFLRESYRETEGQPNIVRRARLLEKVLKNMTIFIDENPIVGTPTKYPVGVNPYPEYSCDWMKKETESSSYLGKIQFGEEERKEISEAVDYWRDKCIESKVSEIWSELHPDIYYKDLEEDWGIFRLPFYNPKGRMNVDYGKVLNKGLNGVVDEIEEQLRKLPVGNLEALKKRETLKAMIIACNAIVAFAERYALLARAMADSEQDDRRKRELERISETCHWVPANRARTFYEAIQSYWFIHLALEIDHLASGISPGRFCLYMYPFYESDRREGRISDEEVIELLELLFIKHTAFCHYASAQVHRTNQGALFQNVALGGVNAAGEDATTDLDFLVLEAQKRVRMPQPTLSILWHDKLSQEFLLKAAEVVSTGIGMPAFFNSDLITQRLIDQGASLEDARNHCIIGCVESGFSHTAKSLLGTGINMPKFLEIALNNGRDPLTGRQVGPQTGNAEAFASYDDLHEAIKKQFEYFLKLGMEIAQLGSSIRAGLLPYPLASALVDDCIAKGTEINAGGSRYCMDGDSPVGITDLADSLSAIKKLVFEDRQIPMKVLIEALKADFEGHEELRHSLLRAPKYGNDDSYVDGIARKWYDIFWEEHQKYKDYLGNPARAIALSVVWHNPFGTRTGALPSGRKAHLSLTDGAGSASPGMDKNGPTALIKSVTKAIDCGRFASNLLNMKFHPSALASKEGLTKLLALIKSYMDLGGNHVQFNVVSAQTLKDAQVHPEKYRDLIVRVAGFSAFFIHLDLAVQNQIIARTELTFR